MSSGSQTRTCDLSGKVDESVLVEYAMRGHAPVSHCLLPPLQLRDLVDLETEDAWTVSVGLESDTSSAHALADALGLSLIFASSAKTEARVRRPDRDHQRRDRKH